ncbi:MAG: ATP-binding protein [Phycisphaerales bacterium]|nr:ATP-binding protein [Phycisphaerales bacterium]
MSSIAGAYLRDFEPFVDQPVEFKAKVSPELADVHFFVGQNGTGKTRLLSLLAAACGNDEELKFRTNKYSSCVVARTMENGTEKFQAGTSSTTMVVFPPPLSLKLSNFGEESSQNFHDSALVPVVETIAMAFRSVPSLEDKQVAPMAEAKWSPTVTFLRFTHHTSESAQLCQSLANLKVRMGIVSSDPNDRTVRMVQAFDKAIQSITSSELVITVGYVKQEFRLKVSWLGKEMQLKQLPDGLRSIVGWLASVMCKLDFLLPDAARPLEQPMILLLDEPDAHLHPAWQRKLIPAVQQLLPNAQIFVATHSPFVISSVNAGWIYVFEADKEGKVTIKPPMECKPGDSYIDVVEDVLGITERFDPETEKDLGYFRTMRDGLKLQPNRKQWTELLEFANSIAKRGQTLEFMMGREMAQLKSQLPSTITEHRENP